MPSQILRFFFFFLKRCRALLSGSKTLCVCLAGCVRAWVAGWQAGWLVGTVSLSLEQSCLCKRALFKTTVYLDFQNVLSLRSPALPLPLDDLAWPQSLSRQLVCRLSLLFSFSLALLVLEKKKNEIDE